MKLENRENAIKILAAMKPDDFARITMEAGIDPGGGTQGRSHVSSEAIVYNAMKRVLAFSELVRKNPGLKSVLERSIQTASKQAFDIFEGKGMSSTIGLEYTLDKLSLLKIQRTQLAGNKLGLPKARQLYEDVIGDILEDHVEYPLHVEPPACISIPEREGCADLPEPEAFNDHSAVPPVASIRIVILQFSQTKSWFPTALLESPELDVERQALFVAGFSLVLASGAKIFVSPKAYDLVVGQMSSMELKTSHVIVADYLEEKVTAVVEAARAVATRAQRGSCKLKDRVELIMPATQDSASPTPMDDLAYIVKRTFIEITIPSSMRSASSVRPFTV